jgi:prepilin-type N-terminal cleavage/methylation domain-containing protein
MAQFLSHPRHRKRGFTLLEFLFALGIFVVLAGTVVHFLRGGTEKVLRGMTLSEAALARDKLLQWLESDLESIDAGEIHPLPNGAFWLLPAPIPGTEIQCVYLLDRSTGRLHRQLLPQDIPIQSANLPIESVLLERVEEFSLESSSAPEGGRKSIILRLRLRGEPATIRSYPGP